jgi:ATP-dependent RNA helicase DeaD
MEVMTWQIWINMEKDPDSSHKMKTFSELGLNPALEKALALEEIVTPTAIQAEAIPVLLAGKDTYISSETGTGKTLAYLLPLFSRIDPALRTLQALVIVPTHELAMQIQQQAISLEQHAGLGIRTQVLVGSGSMKRQIERLKKKPHLVVGTPGRIRGLIRERKLKAHTAGTVVVDEVDRLLLKSSLDLIRRIIGASLKDGQRIFVSATEQKECSLEAESLSVDLVQVHVGCNRVSDTIDHLYFICEERDKPDLLRKLIHALDPPKAIVFAHRNTDVEIIADKLAFHKVRVIDIHSSQDNLRRKKAMDDVRGGRAQVLIASDVASRGLDIKGVTHIFNLDVPTQAKAYLHRTGRTGRAGRHGVAISLIIEPQVRLIRRHERQLGITITPARLRGGKVFIGDDR